MKKGLLALVFSLLACVSVARCGDEPLSCDNCWVEGGYLYWWMQSLRLPPLVTTGTATGVAQSGQGILGQPGTTVLIGDGRISEPWLQGGQIAVGWWCDCDHTVAVEGSFFGLFQRHRSDAAASDNLGNPVLARPVVDARSGQESALLVSSPGAFSATDGIGVDSSISMLGAEANLLWVTEHYVQPYCNLITGIRFLQLDENLNIAQQSFVLAQGVGFFNGVPVGQGNSLAVHDNILTSNDFVGGQVGARCGFCWGGLTGSLVGKLAIGGMHQEVTLFGSTTVSTPGAAQTATTPGGLFALSTNSGRHRRTIFAFLPGADATLSFQLTSNIRLMAGYSILFLSSVVRPGDAIDRAVNRSVLPTSQVYNPSANSPARPGFSFSGESFWAQGATVGLSLSY
jgi:hypothetical protein